MNPIILQAQSAMGGGMSMLIMLVAFIAVMSRSEADCEYPL